MFVFTALHSVKKVPRVKTLCLCLLHYIEAEASPSRHRYEFLFTKCHWDMNQSLVSNIIRFEVKNFKCFSNLHQRRFCKQLILATEAMKNSVKWIKLWKEGQAFLMKQIFYIVFVTPIKILEFCRSASCFLRLLQWSRNFMSCYDLVDSFQAK